MNFYAVIENHDEHGLFDVYTTNDYIDAIEYIEGTPNCPVPREIREYTIEDLSSGIVLFVDENGQKAVCV